MEIATVSKCTAPLTRSKWCGVSKGDQGRVPSVLFLTPVAIGVTTGVAAPMNTSTAVSVVTQTLPEPSTAMAFRK